MQNLMCRRECLRMVVAGLGLIAWEPLGLVRFPAHAATAPDRLNRAREILKAIILEHAATDNPWLLIHGIRAMGKDFRVGDELAVAHLCRRYLKERNVNGKSYLYMPIADEGHTNAFLSEAVLDAGIDQTYAFRINDRDYTVADLVAGAKALFTFDASSFDARSVTFNPDDLAWSLIVFAHTTDPSEDGWINAYGKRISLPDVVEFAIVTLERATGRLIESMRSNSTERSADEIDKFSCAGTHLIYGLTTCLRFGHNHHLLTERMKPQFDLLVWRLGADMRLIDRYYDQIAGQYSPSVTRMYRWDTKLKFLGHAFEVINYARRFNLFQATPTQNQLIRLAQQNLMGVVENIEQAGIGKYAEDKMLFNLLVGDACHAYHALRIGNV